MSANTTSRNLAGTAAGQNVNTRTNVVFSPVEIALGAVDCAATQTAHLEASIAFECWWAATARTDHKVSSRHDIATPFAINRMLDQVTNSYLNLH